MANPKPDAPTSDPLYGATPPPTTSSEVVITPGPPNTQVSSPEPRPSATIDPLYGATPAPPETALDISQSPPRRPHSLLSPPTRRSSSLPTYLSRISTLLSIILGTSAVITLAWSYFLLPLLHSSFSARKVIVEAQVDRFSNLLAKLKGIRSCKIYTPPPSDDQLQSREGEPSQAKLEDDSTSLSTPTEFSTLSTSLQTLKTALAATSTTRTSLLSTLESYTSHLHREIYLRNSSGANNFGLSVGLGSLSDNLSKESGKGGKGEGLGRGMEEWDAVRKEVRGVKGLLLGRRNFGMVNG